MNDKRLKEILVHFSNEILDWANETNDIPDLLDDGSRKGTISKCIRSKSKHGNDLEIIEVLLDDGEKACFFITLTPECQPYIYKNFFEPLGIMGFDQNSTIQEYRNFYYNNLIGTHVLCETKYDDSGKLMIERFEGLDY